MKISRGRPSVVGWVAMGNLVLLLSVFTTEPWWGAHATDTVVIVASCLAFPFLACASLLCMATCGPHPGDILVMLAFAPINAYVWARLVTWPFRNWFTPEEEKAGGRTGKPNPVTLAAVGNLVLLATLAAFTGFLPELPGVCQKAIAWLAFLLGLPLSGFLLLFQGLDVFFSEQMFAFIALAPINAYLWARLVTWPFRRQRRDAERSGEQTDA